MSAKKGETTIDLNNLPSLAVLADRMQNVNSAVEAFRAKHDQAITAIVAQVTDVGKTVQIHMLDDAKQFGDLKTGQATMAGQRNLLILTTVGATLSFLSGLGVLLYMIWKG